MSIVTNTLASFALATASFAAGATPASAAPSDDLPSVAVHYGDLDLTDMHDVARLNRRVLAAAVAVCGTYDLRDLQGMASAEACRNEAIAAAEPEVKLAVARAASGQKLAGTLPAGILSVR